MLKNKQNDIKKKTNKQNGLFIINHYINNIHTNL